MNHVQQTIQHINSRISTLTTMRDALASFEQELISLAETAPKPAKPAKPAKAARRTPRPAVVRASKAPAKRATVAAAPAATASSAAPANGEPVTFAGAIKRMVRESAKPMTISEIYSAIQSRWPALAEDKDGNNVMVNLTYWASQGKCEKLGRGALATFKVLEPEYFQETQTA
ncbi:MAG: hypothetical protein WCS94_14195 [Verrucomicrobiota bacterium]